jgi:hypothetical protein
MPATRASAAESRQFRPDPPGDRLGAGRRDRVEQDEDPPDPRADDERRRHADRHPLGEAHRHAVLARHVGGEDGVGR